VLKIVSQRHFPQDEILQAVDAADIEMLGNGIVAVGDICNTSFTLAKKKNSAIRYYNFVEVSGWNPAVAQLQLSRSIEIMNAFAKFFPQQTSLIPHAPYSVSNELWQLLHPYFSHKIISIHNQESIEENKLFTDVTGDFLRLYRLMDINNPLFSPSGKSSLQTYFTKLEGAKNIILVHNTFSSEEDINFIIKNAGNNSNVYWCLCPAANLYIEKSLPPLDIFA